MSSGLTQRRRGGGANGDSGIAMSSPTSPTNATSPLESPLDGNSELKDGQPLIHDQRRASDQPAESRMWNLWDLWEFMEFYWGLWNL